MITLAGGELMPLIEHALSRNQPVRMTVHGLSMVPFIFNGDTIDIEPAKAPLLSGEIVLARHAQEQFVVHRIVRITGGRFFLRGDAHTFSQEEGPIRSEDIIGRVICSSHKGRIRSHNGGVWKTAGQIWSKSCPLGYGALFLVRSLHNAARMILGPLRHWWIDLRSCNNG